MRAGHVDEVIPPSHTRDRLAGALNALETGDRATPGYTNVPL
jgi:acetyl-CoA carboxylase carboxyltransferase component